MTSSENWRPAPGVFIALGLPSVLWLTVFFVIPLSFIFILSFSEKTGVVDHQLTWTAAHYLQSFNPIYLAILGKSLLIAGAATAICLAVGYPVALAIAFAPDKYKTPLLIAITLPFWINILIRTYALIAVFRTRGFLNFTLEWLWDAGDGALRFIGLERVGGIYPFGAAVYQCGSGGGDCLCLYSVYDFAAVCGNG